MTMRAEHGIKKSHVGEKSKYRAMNGWIAGERPDRTQPYVLFEGARFVPAVTNLYDLGEPSANGLRHRAKSPQHFGFARRDFRQCNFGHRNGVFEPRLLDLERRREGEN